MNEYIVFIVIYNLQDLQEESNHGSFCLPWPHIAATDGAHEDDLVLKVPLVSIMAQGPKMGIPERSWFSPVKSMAIEMVPMKLEVAYVLPKVKGICPSSMALYGGFLKWGYLQIIYFIFRFFMK